MKETNEQNFQLFQESIDINDESAKKRAQYLIEEKIQNKNENENDNNKVNEEQLAENIINKDIDNINNEVKDNINNEVIDNINNEVIDNKKNEEIDIKNNEEKGIEDILNEEKEIELGIIKNKNNIDQEIANLISEEEENKINNTEDNIIENEIKYEKEIDPELLIDNSSEIDEFVCPLCKGILNEPIIDKCSHVFCKACIEKYYNIYKQCPISKNKINIKEITSINIITNRINKNKIKCKNYNKGCDWIGKILDMKNHILNDCQKTLIKCPFENCNLLIMKEHLDNHIKECDYRNVECQDCHNNFPFKILIEQHSSVCEKKKIECPQKCGLIIERGNIDKHIKDDCDCTFKECCFNKYGCSDKYMKKEFETKMEKDSHKHLLLLTKIINDLNKKINQIENNQKFNPLNHKRYRDFNHNKYFQNENKGERNKNKIGNHNNFNININKIENNFQTKNKNEVYFDMENLSQDISIRYNIATFNTNEIKEHIFLFANKKYDIDLYHKNLVIWEIKLKTNSKWIGFGICDKEKVLLNHCKFCIGNKPDFNNGCFLISNNGFSWNSNNINENNVKINFPKYQNNMKFIIKFEPIKNELKFFYCDNCFCKLSNIQSYVSPFKLTPCIVFLNNYDTIEFNMINY